MVNFNSEQPEKREKQLDFFVCLLRTVSPSGEWAEQRIA